jgi:hypothetical protein
MNPFDLLYFESYLVSHYFLLSWNLFVGSYSFFKILKQVHISHAFRISVLSVTVVTFNAWLIFYCTPRYGIVILTGEVKGVGTL